MAENKKSFILYTDSLTVIDELPREVKGDLLQLIFDYVNDRNPEPTDLLLKTAFAPIKNHLKRDLKIWQEKKKKLKKAGKQGGIKSGESRRCEAKRSQASKNEANEAVSVTATVNVNDNVTVIHPRQQIIEALSKSSYGTPITELEVMADEIIKEYAGKKIGNIQALANKWVQNQNEALSIPKVDKPKYSYI